MKANEAPEKLYLSDFTDTTESVFYVKQDNTKKTDIEYIRKDAFIEKSCEFIRKGGKRGDAYIVTEFGEEVFDFVQFAEDFKNYLKGE